MPIAIVCTEGFLHMRLALIKHLMPVSLQPTPVLCIHFDVLLLHSVRYFKHTIRYASFGGTGRGKKRLFRLFLQVIENGFVTYLPNPLPPDGIRPQPTIRFSPPEYIYSYIMIKIPSQGKNTGKTLPRLTVGPLADKIPS